MSKPGTVLSHHHPASMAEFDARPRWLQLLFVFLIVAGIVLIAISVAFLISGANRGNAPDAWLAAPGVNLLFRC